MVCRHTTPPELELEEAEDEDATTADEEEVPATDEEPATADEAEPPEEDDDAPTDVAAPEPADVVEPPPAEEPTWDVPPDCAELPVSELAPPEPDAAAEDAPGRDVDDPVACEDETAALELPCPAEDPVPLDAVTALEDPAMTLLVPAREDDATVEDAPLAPEVPAPPDPPEDDVGLPPDEDEASSVGVGSHATPNSVATPTQQTRRTTNLEAVMPLS